MALTAGQSPSSSSLPATPPPRPTRGTPSPATQHLRLDEDETMAALLEGTSLHRPMSTPASVPVHQNVALSRTMSMPLETATGTADGNNGVARPRAGTAQQAQGAAAREALPSLLSSSPPARTNKSPPQSPSSYRQQQELGGPGMSLQSHLYVSGFIHSNLSDIHLVSFSHRYSLHRLILGQSEFFAQLLAGGFAEEAEGGRAQHLPIRVEFELPMTRAAFEFCLARLYGGGPRLAGLPWSRTENATPLTEAFERMLDRAQADKPHLRVGQGNKHKLAATAAAASMARDREAWAELDKPDIQPATPTFLLALLATSTYLEIGSLQNRAFKLICEGISPWTVGTYLRFASGKGLPRNDGKLSAEIERACRGLESVGQPCTSPRDAPPSIDGRRPRSRRTTGGGESALGGAGTTFVGPMGDKVGEACVCWLAKFGADILLVEEWLAESSSTVAGEDNQQVERELQDGLAPPELLQSFPELATPQFRVWSSLPGGLSARYVRGILSSDAFFIPSEVTKHHIVVSRRAGEGNMEPERGPDPNAEWDRYLFARRVVELRRRERKSYPYPAPSTCEDSPVADRSDEPVFFPRGPGSVARQRVDSTMSKSSSNASSPWVDAMGGHSAAASEISGNGRSSLRPLSKPTRSASSARSESVYELAMQPSQGDMRDLTSGLTHLAMTSEPEPTQDRDEEDEEEAKETATTADGVDEEDEVDNDSRLTAWVEDHSQDLNAWEQCRVEEEEKEFQLLFRDGIHYSQMTMRQLFYIAEDRSATTGKCYVPLEIVQRALFELEEFKARIPVQTIGSFASAFGGHHRAFSASSSSAPVSMARTLDQTQLGLSVLAKQVTAPDFDASETRRYFPIPGDETKRINDTSLSLAGPGEDPVIKSRVARPPIAGPSEFFGLASEVRLGTRGPQAVVFGTIDEAEAGRKFVAFEPCRVSAEFKGIGKLREKERLYSETFFYAGSWFNIYLQKIQNTKKGTQLGIYLHRQSPIEAFPMPCQAVLPSTSPSQAPFVDARKAVQCYFSVVTWSSSGTSLTRFSSGLDSFAQSQSWGWKSSSQRSEEYLGSTTFAQMANSDSVLGSELGYSPVKTTTTPSEGEGRYEGKLRITISLGLA